MEQVNCYRITPHAVVWSSGEGEESSQRELFASDLVRLREHKLVGSTVFATSAFTLYLLTAGELELGEGQIFGPGDLVWCPAAGESLVVGDKGVTFYAIEALQNIGRELAAQHILGAQIPWESFDDPAGRPTQPVQVLLDGSLSALRTRFDPSYIAGEHWHDFDTLYFISDGRMQFGDEGWFDQGDIRAVHGGHSYGPERPGADGVEFVLISLGGPVALHWSDLEPPP